MNQQPTNLAKTTRVALSNCCSTYEKPHLKAITLILTLNVLSTVVSGQVTVKYEIDCDSVLPNREGVHVPLEDDWFMASINLDFARDWKNQDTIKLTPFTTENLQNGMTCIEMSPPTKKYKEGRVVFAPLNYWEHGEYGLSLDGAYEAEVQFEGDVLVLRDKLWIDLKPRGRKHKYQVIRTGRNCISWVKLNPSTKKLYPREIPARKAKKIISVKNY